MRASYRRQRRPDPLASPLAVRAVLSQLRAALPHIVPRSEREQVRLLRAVRHIQRYQATDTRRGRPSRWQRTQLVEVAGTLLEVLERETGASVGLGSFVVA